MRDKRKIAIKDAAMLAIVVAANLYVGTEDYNTMELKTRAFIEDDDGIERELAVSFDYRPEEEPTSDHPGCDEAIENISAVWRGWEAYPGRWDEEIEQACWDCVHELQQPDLAINRFEY